MKNIKNKRALLLGGILCLAFATIAITIAYNRDSSVLANNFELGGIYKTVTTEEFIGPDNWAPCQEVPKTVTVKNEGNVDVAVRISYEEYWRDGREGYQEYRLSPEKNGVRLAIIEFQNETDWELRDGYYYYKHTLAPGESSNSLFKSVTLNCEANMVDEDSYCSEMPDGTTECMTAPVTILTPCTLGGCSSNYYQAAKYHLKIKVETIQADKRGAWSWLSYIIANSGSRSLAQKTEKGKKVYVFKRTAGGNNVIWSNMCWQVVRTTYTDGVKIIYNGLPETANGVQACPGESRGIVYGGASTFEFDTAGNSGYMYGDTVGYQDIQLAEGDTTSFTLSNGVTRNGNVYLLDTTAGQYLEWTSADSQDEAKTRYHYFCTDGSSSCDSSKIGYLLDMEEAGGSFDGDSVSFTPDPGYSWRLTYLPLGGYDDISDLKNAVSSNTRNSSIKTTIESWFEGNNLDDDDLEDAVFCSDRTYATGSLAGPEISLGGDRYAFASRKDSPTFDCANKNDAFTKDDTTNGNGKLLHKVGLLTADELAMTGIQYHGQFEGMWCSASHYLWNEEPFWLMTPDSMGRALYMDGQCGFGPTGASLKYTVRPVVSLKAETVVTRGDGTANDPYIVE